MTKVLFDARLAVRGLGIASATSRLLEGFAQLQDLEIRPNATTHGWNRRGKLDTIVRSGLLDVYPPADPRTWSVDVVHYFGNTAPRWGGQRSVVTVHDLMMLSQRARKARAFEALLVPGLRREKVRIAAISSRTAESINRLIGVPLARIEVVPHGRRVLGFCDRPREHILMFGGSSDLRKRVGLGLTAYRRYVETSGEKALPLVIAGRSGVSPADLRLVEGLSVTLLRDPGADEVEQLLARSACLVFPSRWEGFGLPLVEAGEAGTPVVVGKDADLPSEPLGSHAVWAADGDVSSWASAISRAAAMGTVPEAVSHLPTWEQVATRYRDLYLELSAT